MRRKRWWVGDACARSDSRFTKRWFLCRAKDQVTATKVGETSRRVEGAIERGESRDQGHDPATMNESENECNGSGLCCDDGPRCVRVCLSIDKPFPNKVACRIGLASAMTPRFHGGLRLTQGLLFSFPCPRPHASPTLELEPVDLLVRQRRGVPSCNI